MKAFGFKYLPLILALIFLWCSSIAQHKYPFEKFRYDSEDARFYKIFVTRAGQTIILNSSGLWFLQQGKLKGPIISNDEIYKNDNFFPWQIPKVRSDLTDETYGSVAEGPDSSINIIVYNKIFVRKKNGQLGKLDLPPGLKESDNGPIAPQILKANSDQIISILRIWIDHDGKIYIGTKRQGFSIIEIDDKIVKDKNSDSIGKLQVKRIVSIVSMYFGSVYSFAQDPKNKYRVWLGTNRGLYFYNLNQGNGTIFPVYPGVTVTEIFTGINDKIWFSSLEKGMGSCDPIEKKVQFFPYEVDKPGLTIKPSVYIFCLKSQDEFYVATSWPSPAIFNTKSHTYTFLDDSLLSKMPGSISDIKADKNETLLLLKQGNLFYSRRQGNYITGPNRLNEPAWEDSVSLIPFVKAIELADGTPLATLDYNPELLKKIILKPQQNNLMIYFEMNDFAQKGKFLFSWKVDGYSTGWELFSKHNQENLPVANLSGLKPGTYKFQLKTLSADYNWNSSITELLIIIKRPVWQEWWFWTSIIIGLAMLIYFIVKVREKVVRRQEQIKASHEKELLEMEAKALQCTNEPPFHF